MKNKCEGVIVVDGYALIDGNHYKLICNTE